MIKFLNQEVMPETIGTTLHEREMNGYDDSDFYAVYWNSEKGCPEEIMVWTTRFASIGCENYKIDATDEIRAIYNAWKEAKIEKEYLARKEAKAKEPHKGDTVRVNSLSKKWNGFVGEVKWIGQNSYSHFPDIRVGIKIEGIDKLVYVKFEAVEKIQPENQTA